MDFSRSKPNLSSSKLKDTPTGREIMYSQLSQVVLILKRVLETTGMWTLAVLFICQISFIFFQITKLLTMRKFFQSSISSEHTKCHESSSEGWTHSKLHLMRYPDLKLNPSTCGIIA